MTQDTIKDRLRAARALIDQPAKWTQYAFGRDAEGNLVEGIEGKHPAIVARCATCAIMNVCLDGEARETRRYLIHSINNHRASDQCYFSLAGWNDITGRTHDDVMQAFDRAIGEDAQSLDG